MCSRTILTLQPGIILWTTYRLLCQVVLSRVYTNFLWRYTSHTINHISYLAWLIEAEWRIYASVNLPGLVWFIEAGWRICGSKIRPSLVQIMACRLLSASHYLNHWWLIVNWALRNRFQWNLIKKQQFSYKKINFKMSSATWRPFCLAFSVIIHISNVTWFPNLLRISQCTIQNRNVRIYVLNCALWDMEQVRYGIVRLVYWHLFPDPQ